MTAHEEHGPGPNSPHAPHSEGIDPAQRSWRSGRRWARWAAYVAAFMTLSLVVSLGAGVYFAKKPLPTTQGSVELAGLSSPVRVVRDGFGIPQIYADNSYDLFFAQGFVQAQDRFYEMDVRRHITSGRLAELFGPDAVETDRVIRTLGWRRIAEREVAELGPDAAAGLEAFSAGVNAYIAERPLSEMSLEYTVLGLGGLDYTAEPWTPADSVAWLKAMAWDLRGNMSAEMDRTSLATELDDAQVNELYPDYPYDRNEPIVSGDGGAVVDRAFGPDTFSPDPSARSAPSSPAAAEAGKTAGAPALAEGQAQWRSVLARTLASAEALPTMLGTGEGVGSNSWVVSGDRSATGMPLLANDPHLAPTLPGVWYQMGLHCTEVTDDCPYDVSGFTFAGFPGVVIGHNDRISWGFTNLGPDVTDLYFEQTDGDTYRRGKKMVPFEISTETIKVAGGQPEQVRIRQGVHGPVISDALAEWNRTGAQGALIDGSDEVYALSLAWTALQPTQTAESVFALNKAQNFEEFRAAAELFAAPSQNMVYADVDGNIGYQAPGLIPVRPLPNDGSIPSPGWLKRYDWTGKFIDFEELPWVYNPDEGVIVTANQAPIGPNYANFLGNDFDYGYRAQRIRELLDESGTITVEDMASIQLDTRDPLAEVLVPRLVNLEIEEPYVREAVDLLDDWDYDTDADSAAAAYYNAVWSSLLDNTFGDDLPDDVAVSGGSRWMTVIGELLEKPDASWWDDSQTELREDRDDILRVAAKEARDDLVRLQSRRVAKWSWGHQHTLTLRNQTLGSSGVAPVERLFNRGDWKVGGGSSIVNAMGWSADEGYEVDWVPSMRMVISMGDLDESRWINLTGASGHAFSSNYTDQTDLWAAGKTLPWVFSADAVEKASAEVLTLTPAS